MTASMSASTINVSEHFKALWTSHVQDHEAWKLRCLESDKTAKERATLIAPAQRELDEKEQLKLQAAANGLDTAPLDREINRLRDHVGELRAEQSELTRLANQPPPNPPYDHRKVQAFVQYLEESKCNLAETLPSLDAAASLVEVDPTGFEFDASGAIVKATIGIANRRITAVPVSKKRPRFGKWFRPPSLRWLPELKDAPQSDHNWQRDHGQLRVIYIEDQKALLLPDACHFSGRVKGYADSRLVDGFWVSEPTSMHYVLTDADGPFIFASKVLETALANAGGSIRLNDTYQNAFLERIRDKIVEHTTETPRWPMNTEFPDSATVAESIKEDLSLIAAAPWANDIKREWAKFKYTLESTERPKLWREPHVNHYGLRLRTRDHTWILAQLYIDRSQPPGKPGDPIQVCEHSSVRRLGRMYMQVSECEDRSDY